MILTSLTLLWLLGGMPSANACMDRCSGNVARCTERCGTSNKCMEACSRSAQTCTDGCSAAQAKADAKPERMPCGVNLEKGTTQPCSDAELKSMDDAMKKNKSMCKDAKGAWNVCPDVAEKNKDGLKKLGIKLDCEDASGMPIKCPAK